MTAPKRLPLQTQIDELRIDVNALKLLMQKPERGLKGETGAAGKTGDKVDKGDKGEKGKRRFF